MVKVFVRHEEYPSRFDRNILRLTALDNKHVTTIEELLKTKITMFGVCHFVLKCLSFFLVNVAFMNKESWNMLLFLDQKKKLH